MTGIGKMRITRSVIMFEMAFAYHAPVRLMQVPGMDLSQEREMGVHWKMVTMMLMAA